MSRTRPHRGFSYAIHEAHARNERERLLNDDEAQLQLADDDGLYPPNCGWTSDNSRAPNPHADLPVYTTIHRIRRDIINTIDDAYSFEQLKSPRINITVVRPLVDRFYAMKDVSIVYCLLVNRTQFIREQSFFATHHQNVNLTRAMLCEILAEKILRRFSEHNPGPKGLLLMANILVAGFEPFQNAPEEVVHENMHAIQWAIQKRGGKVERKLTSLEVAIISESKSFLATSACQKVVDAIYSGKLVYTPFSFIDILPDHWKHRPISLYDPRKAPLLNQYRLNVPRTRNVIEVGQFVILLALYVVVMVQREERLNTHYSNWELAFDIYAAGWVLDQVASMLEHGWQVYSQNLWAFLDITFSGIYILYLVLRIQATLMDGEEHVLMARTALDILAVGAPVLIPRLAFNLMSENILFVSLRAMMSDFLTLTALAIWCFAGFLLSMKWLHNGAHQPITISKWLIWIWFGLDGTGIQRSGDFHWLLGPALMVLFAFLGNTLFLTILVSMLSNTFSNIVQNATAEIQFRRAVLTFEGVKSDAIFAYMPPFNIAALVILTPLRFVLTPRWFHKVHVTASRLSNAPFLLLICLFERRTLWIERKPRYSPSKTWGWLSFLSLERFSVHGDIQAVFDSDPPQCIVDQIAADDHLSEVGGLSKQAYQTLERQFMDRRPSELYVGQDEATNTQLEEEFGSVSDHSKKPIEDTGVSDRLQRLEDCLQRIEALLKS